MRTSGFALSALLLLQAGCDKKPEASLSEARQEAREGLEAAGQKAEEISDKTRHKAAELSATAQAKLEVAGEKLQAAGDELEAAGKKIGEGAARAADFVETQVVEAGARIDAVKAELSRPQLKAAFLTPAGVALKGDVALDQEKDGVHVSVGVKKAPPGKLAVHVHLTSDCSDIPNKSMGAHFEPEGHKHGLPSALEHHLGDLGNMQVDAKGDGKLEIVVPTATLERGDARSFAGRSVVIHQGVDGGTGESGNSGTPIACAPLPQGS